MCEGDSEERTVDETHLYVHTDLAEQQLQHNLARSNIIFEQEIIRNIKQNSQHKTANQHIKQQFTTN